MFKKILKSAGVVWALLPQALNAVPLLINSNNTSYSFDVELALTPEKIENGLMFRESLAEDRGMLFVFEGPRRVKFWMKNTLIPLDMIFLDHHGKILGYHENAEPKSLKSITSSSSQVSAVLEVPGGTAKRLGIKIGDTMINKVFSFPVQN